MSGNTETIQGLYDAFAKGDVPGVLGSLSDDIAWTEAEGFPHGGTYHGPNGVLEGVFMPIVNEWDGFTVAPRELIDAGEIVVALGTYSGTYKATGKSFSAEFAHVWRLRDGKVYKFDQYVDTKLVDDAM